MTFDEWFVLNSVDAFDENRLSHEKLKAAWDAGHNEGYYEGYEEGIEFASHDDKETNGELALAAACYATPVLLYKDEKHRKGHSTIDAWPWENHDKREYGWSGNLVQNNLLPPERRIKQLVKAAALITAEIERISRIPHKVLTQ